MTGRALVFSNPEVVRLVSGRFVPYAGDQWYLHRQQDEDGRFFWKVADQGHNRNRPRDATRQGIYVAEPDGRMLASSPYRPSAQAMIDLLKGSLERRSGQAAPVALEKSAADRRFARVPPEGGLILNVFTRIPLEPKPGEKWTPNQAIGRDHMWLTREDARALLPPRWAKGTRYPVPPAVAERLVRFHLVDNVRGEPPMWAKAHVREQALSLEVEDPAAGRLRLSGAARVAANDGSRGYDARLQGVIQVERASSRVRRCDLLAWGDYWGEGTFTRGAPEGKFPLLVAFSLAGSTPADRVPPQGSREIDEYLGTGR